MTVKGKHHEKITITTIDSAVDLGDEGEKETKRTDDMNDMNMVKRYEFERLPRETNKAYAAFKAYLDMGPERSLATVGTKLGKSKRLMERWSLKYGWVNRVAAYVNYIAEVERLAIESLAREQSVDWKKVHDAQRIEEWKLRQEFLENLRDRLRQWKANPDRCGSLEGLARMAEIFMKLGRMASGMPMETKEVKTEVKGTIEVEWEVALKKVYGRVAAPAVIDVQPVTSDQATVNSESERSAK